MWWELGVTVLSGPERRRRWSSSEKARIAAVSLRPDAVVTAVGQRHDVRPNLLHFWRRRAERAMRDGRGSKFRTPDIGQWGNVWRCRERTCLGPQPMPQSRSDSAAALSFNEQNRTSIGPHPRHENAPVFGLSCRVVSGVLKLSFCLSP